MQCETNSELLKKNQNLIAIDLVKIDFILELLQMWERNLKQNNWGRKTDKWAGRQNSGNNWRTEQEENEKNWG